MQYWVYSSTKSRGTYMQGPENNINKTSFLYLTKNTKESTDPKEILKKLFIKADSNNDFKLTNGEIDKAIRDKRITSREGKLLRNTYNTQIESTANKYNKQKDMEFWEYMQSVNEVKGNQVFSNIDIADHNKESVLKKLKDHPEYIKNIADFLKADKDVAKMAIIGNAETFQDIAPELQVDLEFILQMAKLESSILKLLDETVLTDSFISSLIKEIPETVVLLDNKYINRDHIKQALSVSATLITDIPNALSDDELVKIAISKNGYLIKDVDDKYTSDIAYKDIMIAGIKAKVNGEYVYEKIVDSIKNNDFDINLAAAETFHGRILEDIPERFLKNKKIALKAVEKRGLSIKYFKDFLNDKDVALKAVSNNGVAAKYLSENLRNDRELMLHAIRHNDSYMYYVNSDPEGIVLQYVGDNLKNDKQFLLEALGNIKFSGIALKYAGYMDEDIALAAVSTNAQALLYVNDDLLTKDFMVKAISKNWSVIDNYEKSKENLFSYDTLKREPEIGKYHTKISSVINSDYYIQCKKVQAQLKKIGISNPYIFKNLHDAQIVLNNINNFESTKNAKNISLIFIADSDYNGGFNQAEFINSEISAGKNVIVVQASTEKDIYEVFNELSINNNKIEHLHFLGHTNRDGMGLGTDSSFSDKNEHKYLDVKDIEEMSVMNMAELMMEKSTIVFHGCNSIHLAKQMSKVFPKSNMFASTITTYNEPSIIYEDNHIVDVKHYDSRDNSYKEYNYSNIRWQ